MAQYTLKFKTTKMKRDVKSLWGALFTVFMLFSFCDTQTCDTNAGCFPPNGDFSVTSSRTLEVSSTCGENGNEDYVPIAAETNGVTFTCTGSDIKENMLDTEIKTVTFGTITFTNVVPIISTYWQSKILTPSSPDFEYIIFNFTDNFLIRTVSLLFITPNTGVVADGRPTAIAFDKMDTVDSSWSDWKYYAQDCGTSFPGIPVTTATGPSFNATTVSCSETLFGGDMNTFDTTGEYQEVTFNPRLDYRSEFTNSLPVQSHFITSAVRVRLVSPADDTASRAYYAVAHFTVDFQCSCFGHSNNCTGPNDALCICEHNTDGDHCELCLPLYNNKPWSMGTATAANVCEACDCNNLATSCHYADVKGYGVCDDCPANVIGDHCDLCDQGFTRNELFTPNNTNCQGDSCIMCLSCNCDIGGTDPASQFNCNATTGQCQCKMQVTGLRCDQCRDTFWQLTEGDPDGCIACDCDPIGSYNSTNYCDKTTGVCVCKSNTEGVRCSQCKAATYNISIANEEGCLSCDCDPGASIGRDCHVTTGDCICQPFIGGRDCRMPQDDYFVPKMDYLTFEAEFNNNVPSRFVQRLGQDDVNGTITGTGLVRLQVLEDTVVTLETPRTGAYSGVLRYEFESADSLVVRLNIAMVTPSEYQCDGAVIPIDNVWSLTGNILTPQDGNVHYVFGDVCLLATEDYLATIEVLSSRDGSALLIDSLVLVPLLDNLDVYTSGDSTYQGELSACRNAAMHPSMHQQPRADCIRHEYSIMADWYGSAVACDCTSSGVAPPGGSCDPIGGQCQCQPGVIMRKCEVCRVDTNGSDISVGCTACDCHGQGSLVPSCDAAGICTCQPNVIGDKCDMCDLEHYGINSGSGCVPCTCNPNYSYNNSCSISGDCSCMPGVNGSDSCQQCSEGFYNISAAGCASCGCHVDGSSSHMCDVASGVCECKPAVTGDKCLECKPGYFGLSPLFGRGCIPCFCSGHSDVCSTDAGWYAATAVSQWSSAGSSLPWLGIDDAGTVVMVTEEMIIPKDTFIPQFVMQIKNTANYVNRSHLYFLASQDFLGDKRSSYGLSLTVFLALSISEDLLTNYTEGDVVLQGQQDYTLVTKLPSIPSQLKTEYSIKLTEDFWTINKTDGRIATHEEMISTLSDLKAVMIRGKFSNAVDAMVNLYSVSMEHASRDNSSGVPVNNVETCVCPDGYDGQFCEICAANYKRLDPVSGAQGTCVPCECNAHSAGPCDPEIGFCNCTHNTRGDKCDVCLDGFYGDASGGLLDDCKPCMCPGSVPDLAVNAFASTCEFTSDVVCRNCSEGHTGNQCEACSGGYYGQPQNATNNDGQCTLCNCNGRADDCDSTTGICIDCRNNTGGKDCEICASKYFGNAATFSCQPCSCEASPGSTGECDPTTGECICWPNVQGFQCDRCVANAYNFSQGEGCTMCACHENGSLSLSCDANSGQCSCKTRVTGQNCNVCEDTFWGLGLGPCQECLCDPIGTATIPGETFGICDQDSGQCQCANDGVIGRTCDKCSPVSQGTYEFVKPFYIGSYPDCVLCGECYDNWAKKIDDIGISIQQQYNSSLKIWNHYDNATAADLQALLEAIQQNITVAQDSMGSAQSLTMTLTNLAADIALLSSEIESNIAEIDALRERIQNFEIDRQQIESFTGIIATATGESVSANSLSTQFDAIGADLQTSFDRGNSSWQKISEISVGLQSPNSTAEAFHQRVRAAMSRLSTAMQVASSTEALVGDPFQQAFSRNEHTLSSLRVSIFDAEATVTVIEELFDNASILMDEANATVVELLSRSTALLEEAKGNLVLMQGSKLNASDAQHAAQTAQSAVDQAKDKAAAAKDDITDSLIIVVEGQQQLQTCRDQTLQAIANASSVTSTTLRSLSDMQGITDQILVTSVPSANVDAIRFKAADALQIATTAYQDTQIASVEAHSVLESVQSIQHDLQESLLLQSGARTTVDQLQKDNNTVWESISTVKQVASLSTQQSRSTDADLDAMNLTIADAAQCFLDVKNDADRIDPDSQQTLTKAQTASQTTIAAVNDNVEQKYQVALADSSFAALDQVLTNHEELQADLTRLQGIANLADLLTEVTSQRAEMNQLELELSDLESEADIVVAAFTSMGDSATCISN